MTHPRSYRERTGRAPATTLRHGLTLVETLVVLAIVAALFAITIPVLRGVLAQSQTTQNLSNMSQTMKDFFTWSAANNGRMVNWGLPNDNSSSWWRSRSDYSPGTRASVYPSLDVSWPQFLFTQFGDSGRHWQSTFRAPQAWIDSGGSGGSLADARALDPDWEWILPSDYIYSQTLFTSAHAWRSPGLGLTTNTEYAEYFAVISVADIAHPSRKGVLRHEFRSPGPGDSRLVAFADGSVGLRDLSAGQPTAVPPLSTNVNRPGLPVLSTLNGHLGADW